MITLTTPVDVKSVLGSAATVGYNTFVLASITYDTVAMTIAAQVQDRLEARLRDVAETSGRTWLKTRLAQRTR